jgi:hypothetical protein
MLSSENLEANSSVDADNRLVWRANWRRLDAESLRDSLLYVAGNLDLTVGGPAVRFTDSNNRRAVYGFVSRWKPNPTMTLFDFPLPINTVEQRNAQRAGAAPVPDEQQLCGDAGKVFRQAPYRRSDE